MKLKTIHRIYFGFDGRPDPYDDYLRSWSDACPDFEIMHWNAKNLPMDECEYSKALYYEKDAVFLSDYFRWWVLREFGGLYLDADIEIVNGVGLSSLVDDLSSSQTFDAFIGIENRLGYTAHSMGAKPNSDLAQFMCKVYENMGKLYHLRRTRLIAPQLVQLYFFDRGIARSPEGILQGISRPFVTGRVMVLPQDYFSPLGFGNPPYLECRTENTILCHHFGGSWLSDLGKSAANKNGLRFLKEYEAAYNKNHLRQSAWISLFLFRIEQLCRSLREKGPRITCRKIIEKMFE